MGGRKARAAGLWFVGWVGLVVWDGRVDAHMASVVPSCSKRGGEDMCVGGGVCCTYLGWLGGGHRWSSCSLLLVWGGGGSVGGVGGWLGLRRRLGGVPPYGGWARHTYTCNLQEIEWLWVWVGGKRYGWGSARWGRKSTMEAGQVVRSWCGRPQQRLVQDVSSEEEGGKRSCSSAGPAPLAARGKGKTKKLGRPMWEDTSFRASSFLGAFTSSLVG